MPLSCVFLSCAAYSKRSICSISVFLYCIVHFKHGQTAHARARERKEREGGRKDGCLLSALHKRYYGPTCLGRRHTLLLLIDIAAFLKKK